MLRLVLRLGSIPAALFVLGCGARTEAETKAVAVVHLDNGMTVPDVGRESPPSCPDREDLREGGECEHEAQICEIDCDDPCEPCVVATCAHEKWVITDNTYPCN